MWYALKHGFCVYIRYPLSSGSENASITIFYKKVILSNSLVRFEKVDRQSLSL